MVSSISRSTVPASSTPPSSRVCSARLSRNREATASAWRTCPKANERRNDPSVEGAYAPVKTLPMPPWRSRAMSSMLSAPAAIPATSEHTFNPVWAPLSVGTLNRSLARSRSLARPASAISGTRPAADTRLGSSNDADTTGRMWESCIYKMPFLAWRYGPSASPTFPIQRGILPFHDHQLIGGSRLRDTRTGPSREATARRRRTSSGSPGPSYQTAPFSAATTIRGSSSRYGGSHSATRSALSSSRTACTICRVPASSGETSSTLRAKSYTRSTLCPSRVTAAKRRYRSASATSNGAMSSQAHGGDADQQQDGKTDDDGDRADHQDGHEQRRPQRAAGISLGRGDGRRDKSRAGDTRDHDGDQIGDPGARLGDLPDGEEPQDTYGDTDF